MKRIIRVLTAIAMAALIVVGALVGEEQDAYASDRTGAYALLDSVTLEPAEGTASHVRLTGLFCVATGKRGGTYRTPARGSIVYALPTDDADKQAAAQKSIAALRAAAGTGKIVAFGSRWSQAGVTVTTGSAWPAYAPVFDTGVGARVIESAAYGAIALLRSNVKLVSPIGDVGMRVHEKYGVMELTKIVVENPISQLDGLRLLFEVELENGDVIGSAPVVLGEDGRTTYSAWYPLQENETVKYRVRAVHDDLPQVSVAVGSFTVRKAE